MAKIVIAGRSDCPYFSRVELLGDRLAKNLPSFNLHKIVKTPDEWQNWLNLTCHERGWEHETSPIVWRELIDRGGKGVLIGNASDFQEYVKGYYGLDSKLTSMDMTTIGGENAKTKEEIDAEEAHYKALSKPLQVCVTAADSAVCYNLIPALTHGDCFGPATEVKLKLLGSPDSDLLQLQGLAAETMDMCNGLLRGIEVTKDLQDAFKECSVIVILNDIARKEDEEYEAWILRNSECMIEYANVINNYAHKNTRILIAGNGPVNTNTMVMIQNLPNIPRQNIVGVSRAMENRAKAVIGQRLNVNTAGVVDLLIWGNTNGQHFVDTSKARVHNYDGAIWGPPTYSRSVVEMVHDNKWLEKEYLALVGQRLSLVETNMGHPASGSLARAVTTTLTHWWNGSPLGQMFSLAVWSDGWYGVPEGFVFSYPVTFSPSGFWTVVQDIELTEEMKLLIELAALDLKKEYEVIFPPPKPPSPPAEPEPTGSGSESKEETPSTEETTTGETKTSTEQSGEQTTTTTEESPESGGDNQPDSGETVEESPEAEPEASAE